MVEVKIPNIFRNSGEVPNASYSWAELSSGLGYVVFYGFNSINTSTKDYHLLQASVYSSDIVSSSTGQNDTATKLLDLDFDTSPFNFPATVKGDAIINVGWGLVSLGNATAYVIAKLRKYSGTTETEIGSAQSNTLSVSGGGSSDYSADNCCLKINSTGYTFNEGDILRVTIELWGTHQSASTSGTTTSVAHSPKGLDTDTVVNSTNGCNSTVLQVQIPFKVDL